MRDLHSDFRLLTSPFRVLPDFAIVGEAKCGTTSLYRYLLQHPCILGADRKEPKNFIQYPDSLLYCRSHFPTYAMRGIKRLWHSKPVVSGEATAEYFSYPGAAVRMRNLIPGLKILILLRNPVYRAVSDYQMLSRKVPMDVGFAEIVHRSLSWMTDPGLQDLVDAALTREHFYLRFVGRGVYMKSLTQWFDVFPPSQVLVLKSEELFDDPSGVMNRVHDFVGVGKCKVEDLSARRRGGYSYELDSELMCKLRKFYEPHNHRLYEYLDRDFGWETELDEAVRGGRGQ